MTTGCLVSSVMRWPTRRAMMSFGPPGGNGTISLIGLVGKSCAATGTGISSSGNAAASTPKSLIQTSLRRCLCVCRVQSCTAKFSGRIVSSRRSDQQFVGRRQPDRLLADQVAPDPVMVTDKAARVEVWAVAQRVGVGHHHDLVMVRHGGANGRIDAKVSRPARHQHPIGCDPVEAGL